MNRGERNAVALRTSRMGRLAARTFAVSRSGSVEAVFDRSIYCLLDGGYVCLGAETLGMGPLTATLDVPETRWPSFGFRIGLRATLSPGGMKIGDGLVFDLRHARIWSPPPAAPPAAERVLQGIRSLQDAAAGRVPPEGLGRFLFADPRAAFPPDRLCAHAETPLASLTRWMSVRLGKGGRCDAAEESSWRLLLGLGPGLTPSGDDLVGGMMIALHRLGEPDVLRSLSLAVERALAGRTHPISAAYLRAAMTGAGHEVLHDVLEALLSGDTRLGLRDLLTRVEKVGHTSGWDALAGMALTCRVWTESMTMKQER
jgi:Protein of unknown function (DUF2877)